MVRDAADGRDCDGHRYVVDARGAGGLGHRDAHQASRRRSIAGPSASSPVVLLPSAAGHVAKFAAYACNDDRAHEATTPPTLRDVFQEVCSTSGGRGHYIV